MNKLYKNIGNKVCKVAKLCGLIGVIGIIVGVILILVEIIDGGNYALIGTLVGASGFALIISSWPLYAFGQITNDIREIKNNTAAGNSTVSNDLPEL